MNHNQSRPLTAVVLFFNVVILQVLSGCTASQVIPDKYWEPPLDIATLASMAADVYADASTPICERKPLSDWEKYEFDDREGVWASSKNSPQNTGLAYAIYRKVIPDGKNGIELIVTAFRGTEFNDVGDWCANLNASIDNLCVDQYASAAKQLYEHLNFGYNDFGPTPKWYVVGHSLGGGLAQLIGYRQPRIEQVVVFNSSPVIGINTEQYDPLFDGTTAPNIVSISEKGEILGLPRAVSKLSPRPQANMTNIEVDFLDGTPFYQHKIELMACRLYQSLKDKELQ